MIEIWYSFITKDITKVHTIHAEQPNFSAASNMEMVGIYPAALIEERKCSCRSIKDNITALSKYYLCDKRGLG